MTFRRAESALFAPYKSLGIICSGVSPVLRAGNAKTIRAFPSLFVAIDNVVLHYNAEKLRLMAVSDTLPFEITAVAADKMHLFAASGGRVAVIHNCRTVCRWIDVNKTDGEEIPSRSTVPPVKFLLPFGEVLIVVDGNDCVHVLDIESGELHTKIETSQDFVISALLHPVTYLNKILLGSKDGRLRIVNVKTGRVVHDFETNFGTEVTWLEQSPVVDIVGIGLANGGVVVHDVKSDEMVCTFTHDYAVTALTFRTEGAPMLMTGDASGRIAVWDLEKRRLLANYHDIHKDRITRLQFLHGQPILFSSSLDNSMRTWVMDAGDGLPRQLVILEGHSLPVTVVKAHGEEAILTAGLDGSLRLYSTRSETKRQKLGTAGTMSRARAKRRGIDPEKVRLEPIIEVASGWQREAAWDNVVCRHRNSIEVTTWTTRKQKQGTHVLLHKRFVEDAEGEFVKTVATSMVLSPCGNLVYIGYSSGHIDAFNVQSGIYKKSVGQLSNGSEESKAEDVRAHDVAVRALAMDPLGHTLVSGCENGGLRFWKLGRQTKRIAALKAPGGITMCCVSPVSALLALGMSGAKPGVSIVDILTRKVVRTFRDGRNSSSLALCFSPDGRWLLNSDEKGHIRVWEVATSSLIDVLLFTSPCVGISFSSGGEFLITCHKVYHSLLPSSSQDERAAYVWANKTEFAIHVSTPALPLDHEPLFENATSSDTVRHVLIDDDNSMDAEERLADEIEALKRQLNSSLVTFSGEAPARWVNLPDLGTIRERNKPVQPPSKPKSAPFFLTATPTLEGFEFENMQVDDKEERKKVQAKRSLLELESSFSRQLKQADTPEKLLDAFATLKVMSLSTIDFQIRSLTLTVLPSFLRMIDAVFETRRDFDLAQAYLATTLRVHRSLLWRRDPEVTDEFNAELDSALEKVSTSCEAAWKGLEEPLRENASVLQWLKNALL